MKKIFTTFALTVIFCLHAAAYNQVRLVINEGISDRQLKEKIEHAVSVVMTQINIDHEQNSPKVSFATVHMLRDAQGELNKLWANEHFRCVEEEVVERLLHTSNGYQIRGIPLIVNLAKDGDELGYQEAVINFNREGVITSFYYTINPELYSKLRMEQQINDISNEVTDIKERMMILDYVEHFRTSYNQKDLKFLEQVFSADALIITGKVIKRKKTEMAPAGIDIVYTKQTKREYLDNLKRAFKRTRYIKVTFDDVKIVSHPSVKGIYGVTVKQAWKANSYSDEGYVFMLWDFRNPDMPQIHVRTWQPEYIDKVTGKKMNSNDVFTLGDFDI